MRRLKILIIENALQMTGGFVSALAIENALRETYDIDFLLPSSSTLKAAVTSHGVVCHVLPMSEIGKTWRKLIRYVPMLVVNTFRLRRLLAWQKVDVLVINDYYNLLGAAVRLTGWRGTLLTMVRLMPSNQQPLLNRVWTACGLLFSDHLVAVSRAVAKQLPQGPKTTVLYDPIVFNERHPPPGSRGTAPDGEVRCLYLANYIAGKGHHAALEAFSTAYERNRALRLRFVGGDMNLDKNRAMKVSLVQRVSQMGLNDVVQVNGFSDDVERDIKDADIVLNFSESESFSHTCLEACAYGRPIIATRCGGPEEIVADGVSGLLVPVGDVQAMAEAIETLAQDATLRQRMGKAGRLIVRERFSVQTFRTGFEQLVANGGTRMPRC